LNDLQHLAVHYFVYQTPPSAVGTNYVIIRTHPLNPVYKHTGKHFYIKKHPLDELGYLAYSLYIWISKVMQHTDLSVG